MVDKQMIEELEAEQSMFVQTAHGMSSDGTTLTLNQVTPSTLYFSDRPKRIVGHMTTSDFVDLWDEGDNSFEEDPPNAVLAFLLDRKLRHDSVTLDPPLLPVITRNGMTGGHSALQSATFPTLAWRVGLIGAGGKHHPGPGESLEAVGPYRPAVQASRRGSRPPCQLSTLTERMTR
jgi:hypothetical protein